MTALHVSPKTLAGLSTVCLGDPAPSPSAVRVVETRTARIVEDLAEGVRGRARDRGRPARLDLDQLVACAEILVARPAGAGHRWAVARRGPGAAPPPR